MAKWGPRNRIFGAKGIIKKLSYINLLLLKFMPYIFSL